MKRVAFSNAFNADFKEEKHKRDKDGKFSKSGSGGSSSKSKGGASSKKEAKTEPKGSPPEPVSKVYRKQVETLIKSDAKEAKTLESLYSKLLSAKLLKSSLSSRVK